LESIHADYGRVRIVDLGGRAAYWEGIFGRDWLTMLRAEITLLNLPGETGAVAADDSIFRVEEGDALALPTHALARFDLAHANSVIEHLGQWPRIERFAAILRAVPAYYCQTPYFWFPLEVHTMVPFLHWLPESLRAKIYGSFDLPNFPRAQTMQWAMSNAEGIKLLDRAQMSALFPDAEISFEWVGIPKSIIAIRRPDQKGSGR
jgi:hypothetical protein